MSHRILVEMNSEFYTKIVLAELERRQLVRAALAVSKARRLQRQRLPKTGALRKLVTSLGYSTP